MVLAFSANSVNEKDSHIQLFTLLFSYVHIYTLEKVGLLVYKWSNRGNNAVTKSWDKYCQ